MLSADCILLYNTGDINTARFLIQNGSDNEDLTPQQKAMIQQQDLKRLEAMTGYCKTTCCLRGYILEYFGQSESDDCGTCDICRAGKNITGKKTAVAADAAALISDFVNVIMKGRYTLDEFLRHFNAPDSSDRMTALLRRLIDEGAVPPPEE